MDKQHDASNFDNTTEEAPADSTTRFDATTDFDRAATSSFDAGATTNYDTLAAISSG
jgi:hypothetical protein